MKYIPLGFVKGSVEIGTHIVMLYENEKELLEIFPPFFAAGLLNNELCIVVYPNLRLKQELHEKLAKLVDIDFYIKKKKIEFVYYKNFYFRNCIFNKEKIYWLIDKKIKQVGFKDFDGLRTTSDMSWVNSKFFKKILIYEKGLTKKYKKSPILFICAYPINKLTIPELVDVLQSHMLILYKKDRKWCLSETMERRILMKEIQNLEKFTKLAVGRELKMIKLKEKVEKLEKQLKESKIS